MEFSDEQAFLKISWDKFNGRIQFHHCKTENVINLSPELRRQNTFSLFRNLNLFLDVIYIIYSKVHSHSRRIKFHETHTGLTFAL